MASPSGRVALNSSCLRISRGRQLKYPQRRNSESGHDNSNFESIRPALQRRRRQIRADSANISKPVGVAPRLTTLDRIRQRFGVADSRRDIWMVNNSSQCRPKGWAHNWNLNPTGNLGPLTTNVQPNPPREHYSGSRADRPGDPRTTANGLPSPDRIQMLCLGPRILILLQKS